MTGLSVSVHHYVTSESIKSLKESDDPRDKLMLEQYQMGLDHELYKECRKLGKIISLMEQTGMKVDILDMLDRQRRWV